MSRSESQGVKRRTRPQWLDAVCLKIDQQNAAQRRVEAKRWRGLSDDEKFAEMAAAVWRWREVGRRRRVLPEL
jgi:hypothetical protein